MNGTAHVGREAVAELVQVVPAGRGDLVENWPLILAGLRRVKEDLEGKSFWEPEHIRQALEQSFKAVAGGQEAGAELWLAVTESGRVVGFAVTQPTYDPFIHAPMCFFVWITYKDPAFKGDFIGACCAQLEAVATVRGYRWLEAMTANPAFASHLEDHGWEQHLAVLRKVVAPGATRRMVN